MEENLNKQFELNIPEASDVIVGELAKRGDWVVANIETNSAWPVCAQKVPYRGEEIWLLPIMKGLFPAIAMRTTASKEPIIDPDDPSDTVRLRSELPIMRALTQCWVT